MNQKELREEKGYYFLKDSTKAELEDGVNEDLGFVRGEERQNLLRRRISADFFLSSTRRILETLLVYYSLTFRQISHNRNEPDQTNLNRFPCTFVFCKEIYYFSKTF